MLQSAEYWVGHLGLLPHPEGGYYREIYRSPGTIPVEALSDGFNGDRSFATTIYFLLQAGDFSAFHRIQSDEIWHFYAGGALTVFVIHPDGRREDIHLGADAAKGQVFAAVVPAGSWFGSRPDTGAAYSLTGCTVAPGFDFQDFEMAEKEKLADEYPQHRELISELTR